jgi:hypothetical protein
MGRNADGQASVALLDGERGVPLDLMDLLVVVVWPGTGRAARPCGPAPDLAPVLTGLATRGAHLLVVSAAGAEELFAALRDAGLLPHLRGAAGALRSQRDLRAYLLDHRCRRDRAVFVGGDEAAARTAAWAGYAMGSPCGLVDDTFVGGEPVDVPSVPSVPAVPVA